MNPNSDSTGTKAAGNYEVRAISALSLFRGPVYVFGKPVDRDAIFTNHKGVYKKWVERRQRRLLIKVPFINDFLEKGELIRLITCGYAPLTRLERFLLRYLTVFQRRALFVFTDRRVLFIPTTFTYGYRHSVAEIRYRGCKRIRLMGRSLLFTFHNDGSEQFPYIGRKERRKLRTIVDALDLEAGPAEAPRMTYLCARCRSAVPKNSASCPQCGLPFWTADKAGKMALLIPGGGYFYMGNTLYGVAAGVLELLLAILLGLAIMDMIQGLRGSLLAAFLLGTALAGIKAVSFFHSQELAQGCFPILGRMPQAKSQ